MVTTQGIVQWMHGVNVAPRVGCCVCPDGWRFGECLIEGDGFSALRLSTGHKFGVRSLAVNVTVTGRRFKWDCGRAKVRVRVEFLGDGESSTFSGGYMFV